MENENFGIQDGSGDRQYFTMIPNIVLNHSTAIDQALYMQMKRYAGEKAGGGLCAFSKRYFAAKLGIGRETLKKSLEYLIQHDWVSRAGTKIVATQGGPQEVEVFRVNDIWKANLEHYKGGSGEDHLDKGGSETTKGGSENAKGGSETATNKNYRTIKNISESATRKKRVYSEKDHSDTGETSIDVDSGEIIDDSPETRKYPNALDIFSLWGDGEQKVWRSPKYARERDAAQRLFSERGLDDVKDALEWYGEVKDRPFCPQVLSPYDLYTKWEKLEAWKKKNYD